jgi:hypothetical protein
MLFSGQRLYDENTALSLKDSKETNFDLDRNCSQYIDSSIVSLKSIYIRKFGGHICRGCTNKNYLYEWLKFMSDGKVYLSLPFESYPNTEERSDLNYAIVCRYNIKNGIIVIEVPQLKGFGTYFLYGEKNQNGIEFFARSRRLWFAKRRLPQKFYFEMTST